ncbi:MAG: type II toxin-antitoxin system PemK/MazF family toxin [Planctomycetota bacterium]|nr:type II toxin-antitoxin system PemK/MazF family toxin [Planctomycetota bacterium]
MKDRKSPTYTQDRGDFVGYAVEVAIARDDESSGVVLADHLRNVDWKARKIQLIHRVSDSVLSDVIARIEALLISPDV